MAANLVARFPRHNTSRGNHRYVVTGLAGREQPDRDVCDNARDQVPLGIPSAVAEMLVTMAVLPFSPSECQASFPAFDQTSDADRRAEVKPDSRVEPIAPMPEPGGLPVCSLCLQEMTTIIDGWPWCDTCHCWPDPPV